MLIVTSRQRLGQCSDGELLLVAQDGAHRWQNLSDTGRCQGRCVRLYREALQSTTAFHARIPEPGCLRGTDEISLTQCPQNRGQLKHLEDTWMQHVADAGPRRAPLTVQPQWPAGCQAPRQPDLFVAHLVWMFLAVLRAALAGSTGVMNQGRWPCWRLPVKSLCGTFAAPATRLRVEFGCDQVSASKECVSPRRRTRLI